MIMSMGKGEVAWLVDSLGISRKRLTNKSSFDDRLRIQKAAFLLKHLKVDPFKDYHFNLYLNGPYSPTLAQDYYDVDRAKPKPVDLGDRDQLLRWFMDHDSKWLEVATSIISIKEDYPDSKDEEICSILRLSKPWVSDEMFEKVRRELASRGFPLLPP